MQMNVEKLTFAYSYRLAIHCVHQPHVIAAACIALAAQDLQVALPVDPPWYRVFDVELQDLKQVTEQIRGLYTIRLRWDLPANADDVVKWIAQGEIDSKLTLEAWSTSSEELRARQQKLKLAKENFQNKEGDGIEVPMNKEETQFEKAVALAKQRAKELADKARQLGGSSTGSDQYSAQSQRGNRWDRPSRDPGSHSRASDHEQFRRR
jgi:hypothetical protein